MDRELSGRAGRAFVLDCHSFPSEPLPYELEQAPQRPDFCIGTDEFHTPEGMREWLKLALQSMGFTAALNTPFSGALVPLKHYHDNDNVLAVMIEVNRRLYMQETTRKRSERFAEIQLTIQRVIKSIREGVACGHILGGICKEFGEFIAGYEMGLQPADQATAGFEIFKVFDRLICLTKEPDGFEDYIEHNNLAEAVRVS